MQQFNSSGNRGSYRPARRSGQAGIIRLWLIAAAVLIGVLAIFRFMSSHASAASPTISSGIRGYCLDDYKDKAVANDMVTAWQCNGSAAQDWRIVDSAILHGPSICLTVKDNATTVGSIVTTAPCNSLPGQVWLPDRTGLYNPNSQLCLAAPNNAGRHQLILASCQNQPGEVWSPSGHSNDISCDKDDNESKLVACYAVQEWARWQSGSPNHNTLLNDYTDGAAYEAWCADFVSYVYREAGYPFTGTYDGWDENDANNIQNYGFTEHAASSSYIPKPGDIAYFDYNGGHVEIVVSGGKTPTFIYGNSATIDPVTGNGQMKANTLTNDGSEGQLVYYLSPNKQ